MARKPLLKLLPRLSVGKLLAGYRLNQLPERLLSRALEPLVFPVCDAPLALAPAVLLRADPAPLLLDLPQRVHISVVVERVPPKLLPVDAHPVCDDVDVRVLLIAVRRYICLVLIEIALLKKSLRVGDHLLVRDLVVGLLVADTDVVDVLLSPGALLGRQVHLSANLLRLL